MDLYTIDVNLKKMKEITRGKDRFDFSHYTPELKKKNRVLDRIRRNNYKEKLF